MGREYYISGCVFTSKYQRVSSLILEYLRTRHGIETVRCCVPNYRIRHFNEQMDKNFRDQWEAMPDCADFAPGDTVYSICPNCSAILEETRPEIRVRSLWELLLADSSFPWPDYRGETVAIQDCWRSREKPAVQAAVRRLLENMNFRVHELPANHADTDFCGVSLYRPAPPRNLKLAPKRFVENAEGKFLPHSAEEQTRLMKEYCAGIPVDKIVAYCHYCAEGLELGGKNVKHIASLLFDQGHQADMAGYAGKA